MTEAGSRRRLQGNRDLRVTTSMPIIGESTWPLGEIILVGVGRRNFPACAGPQKYMMLHSTRVPTGYGELLISDHRRRGCGSVVE